MRLSEGCYLGFRRGADTWIARFRDRAKQQHYKALDGAVEYDDAVKLAEQWFAQMNGSAVRTVKRATVRAALEAYLADLRRHGRPDTAKDAATRFSAYGLVPPERNAEKWQADPLSEMELEAATKEDFLDWRDRQREGRQSRSVNRNVRAVVAALNRALELGHVGNPQAWNMTALSDDVDDSGETAVFINPEQRKALIAAADPYTADFLRALELTGARPKEISAATAGDFDGKRLRLAHRKGRPPKLRVRHVTLSEDGVAFFARLAKDKLPKAPLLTEDGKQTWRRHVWAKRINAALEAHNKDAKPGKRIPVGATAYSFRHARISELLQVHKVDPLTVAQQTGTSLAMIEKAYHKFIPDALAEKLAGIKESA